MSEVKCSVFPSGNVSWHQWKQGAKAGEPCQCGQRVLEGGSASEVELAEELLKTKQEVVDVKNKLIDSQDRLQACLLDHKKTLEELVEVRSVLSWASKQRVTLYPAHMEWFFGSTKHHAPTLYAALKSAWEEREK